MMKPDTAILSWLDALPAPGLLVDLTEGGQVRSANEAAVQHFGTDPRGRDLRDLWPDLAAQLTSPDPLPRTFRLHATGPWTWVDVWAFRMGELVAVQLSDATTQQAAETRSGALFDLTVALSRALSAEQAAEVVLRQGLSALGAATGSVFVLDEATRELVHLGSVGYDENYMQGWQRFPVSAPTLLGDAIRGKKPLILSTAEVDDRYPHLRVRRTVPTRAVAALPLLFGGQVVGVMNFGFAGDDPPGNAERTFLLTLAEELAQTLERARLFAQERRARERATLLYTLTAALASTHTPEDVAQVIANTSVPALGATGGGVFWLDTRHEELVLVGASGYQEDRTAPWRRFSLSVDVLVAECARTGGALFLGTPEYPQRYPNLSASQAGVALPLFARGRTLGVLTYGWDEAHTFDPPEREVLTTLAGQCAQALERTLLSRAQDRARQVLARQAALLDQTHDAVFTWELGGGITFWNAGAERLYGFSREEALGQVSHDLLHTDHGGLDVPGLERALREHGEWQGVLRHTTKDAREVIVDSRHVLVPGESGAPDLVLETNRDVTPHHEAEQALRLSEERYRALIEATDQYVWTNSPQGEMVGEQPGWAWLTGQTPQEYRGYGWSERLHPDDREEAIGAWHESVDTRSLYQVEQRVRVRDGTYRSFLVRAMPLLNEDGTLREWIGLHSDITDLKRAELMLKAWGSELERQVAAQTRELRAANEELGAFAYTVSHDLRAPVRHVGSFAGLLRKKVGDDPGLLRYVDQIEGASRRMETLMDALLGLARAGMMELNTADVNLGLLVRAAISDLAPELRGRNVTWQVSELPTVRADVGLLRQVFANLLSNAVKYSQKQEEAVVEVWAEKTPDEVIVAVRDNGAGFDPSYAGKLFGVFQRLHHQNEFEGTGVGLANVKRIIEKHGGRVWAEGRLGEGATFFFSLPRG